MNVALSQGCHKIYFLRFWGGFDMVLLHPDWWS